MTSAGTLNICSANTVDTPASPAPGAGHPGASHTFGQQLRDANQSLSDHPAAESATETERAAARRADKKGQADTASQTAVPLPAVPPSATPLPIPLRFLFPPDSVGNAPAAAAGPVPITAAPAPVLPATPLPSADPRNPGGLPAVAEQAVPEQVVPEQAVPSQSQPPDLSFAVQVGPQDPSAAVPPTPPVEVPVQLKLDDLAGQKDGAKADPKPAGSANAIVAHAPASDFAGSVTPIKETQRTEFGLDPAAPGAGILVREGTFQPPNPGTPAEPAGPPAPNATHAQESAAIQSLPAEPIAKPAAPLKDLSIQVGQNQQDKVELRVVERAGGLEVAVRAANPDLSQGLRQGLSDLVNRLEQNGYRAEAWRPGTTVSTVQGAADTRQKSAQFQNDGSQSQSGSQQGRQQNQQNQTPRPRWVQELEGRLSGESNANAGGSYGVTN